MAKQITESIWDIIGNTELTPEVNVVINALADMCYDDPDMTQLARRLTVEIVNEMKTIQACQ